MGAVQVQRIGVRQQHAPGHVTSSRQEGHVQQSALVWVPQDLQIAEIEFQWIADAIGTGISELGTASIGSPTKSNAEATWPARPGLKPHLPLQGT